MHQTHISTIEAAEQLGISRATMVRLIQAGEIVAEKKTTGENSAYLVEQASVDAYRRKRQQQGNPPTA